MSLIKPIPACLSQPDETEFSWVSNSGVAKDPRSVHEPAMFFVR
jgi:hypothetical protein